MTRPPLLGAKALATTTPEGDPSQSPTLTAAATQMGVIMGTAAYMSPEQAAGRAVDKRGDIWSFGVVLYEMLTGQRLFTGGTVSHVPGAVVHVDPRWEVLPSTTPWSIRQLLRRCLQRDQKKRLPDAGAARLELDEVLAAPDARGTALAPLPQRTVWPRLLATAVAAGLLVGVGVWTLTSSGQPGSGPVVRFVVTPSADEALQIGRISRDVVFSSDGRLIVFRSGPPPGRLSIRRLDELSSTPLRGSEGGSNPFFSPDGEWVGFVDLRDQRLKLVSASGGSPLTVTTTTASRGMSWGADDAIVFATGSSGGLLQVSATGGEPVQLTRVDAGRGETMHSWPHALPNGEGVLFTAWSGSSESSRIAVVSRAGAVRDLIDGGSDARYSETGHLVYTAGATLRAVAFDQYTVEVTGDPVPVMERVNTKVSGAGNFGLSQNGSLLYVTGGPGSLVSLVWVDRKGKEERLPLDQGRYAHPRGPARNPLFDATR